MENYEVKILCMSFVSIGESRVVKVINSPNHICKYDGALIPQVIKRGTGIRMKQNRMAAQAHLKLKSIPN